MQLIINIEKRHFVILMVAISFLGLFMLGNAADVNINDAWHPLQQIAKSESDMTSVDDNQNDIIDESDKSYGLDATSDVDMNNYLISSLSDPTNAQDAATKNYVDSNDPDPTNEIQNLNNVLSEGNWAGYQRIRGLSDPTNSRDAATKDYVDNSGIPSGAVMAFNRNSCPDGWSELTNAQGRTVVGLDSGDSDFNSLGETGGEKEHQLTVDEMPSHSHTYTRRHTESGDCGIDGCGWHQDYQTRSTSEEGGDQPHNNLQPYITLLYCEKD